jgi:putative transposase
MAIPTRAARPGTFFITTATYNRRRLSQVPANCELFLETLQHYRHAGHARPRSPDPHAASHHTGAIGFIKGGFSHRLASKFPAWQRGFTDHRLRDAQDMEIRRAYLHQNPARANLATAAELFPYSSAYRPLNNTLND